VPADDRLGPDQDEVPPPIAAETASENPDQLVASAERRPLAPRAGQDGELVAQQQVLGDQVAAAAEGRTEQVEDASE
jgi:hypothetical protein